MSGSSDGEKTKRVAITLGALGVLALLIVLWFQRGGAGPSPTAKGAAAPGVSDVGAVPSTDPGAAPRPSGTARAPSSAASPPPVLAAGGVEQIRQALEQYETFSQFPPWSRPADGSQTHLWKWNSPDPSGQAFATDAKGKKISAELQLDKMFAGAGESITATVTVWHGTYEDATREPADATVLGYIEVWHDATPSAAGSATIAPPRAIPGVGPPPGSAGFFPVASVSFASAAGGPGHRYVASFTPSTIEALKTQGETRFVASVDPDGHPFPFSESFRYAATTPLVVLDQHSDAIVNGSLEVTVAIDLKRLGPVMVQATLFDASGTTAIATYDDYYRPTELGPQALKITFFGKAIGDRRVDGPYGVRALHGFVRLADTDPPELFWESTTTFTTGSYKATDFSNREWDSPEKTDKINQYKRMLTSLESK